MSHKEIYFHVGLGKTGTTYLQYRFFPKLRGIDYIQRTQYRHYPKLVDRSKKKKMLVSNEMDRQLEEHLLRFVGRYPDARIIIVLRRNDSWLASQYRRQIKNGKGYTFKEFLDLEDDTGFWKKEDGLLYPKLELIQKNTRYDPLVLFHHELKNDPVAFFDSIADYIGATYDKSAIDLNPKHTSYNEKQLRVMKKVSPKLFSRDEGYVKNYYLRKLQKFYYNLLHYSVLYGALLLPESSTPQEPLIDPEELERVREFYQDDWQKCLQFAESLRK